MVRSTCIVIAAISLGLITTITGCGGGGGGGGNATVPQFVPSPGPAATFEDATSTAGLNGIKFHRVAWGDYDQDGYADLLLNGKKLYHNEGDGTFTDVTATAGTNVRNGVNGGIWGDYNNDGLPDFYGMSSGNTSITRDILMKNNGDGTFTDTTDTAGNPTDLWKSEGGCWADVDLNGFIDLYVANYETEYENPPGTLNFDPHPDRFWLNSNGNFTNATDSSGVSSAELCHGRGTAVADFDDDGDPDIYVANYRVTKNYLWRSNGDGTFTDVAETLNLEGNRSDVGGGVFHYGHSIGADWGDYNSDGKFDLLVGNLSHGAFLPYHDETLLYWCSGAPGADYTECHVAAGITWVEWHASPSWADANNDGWLDFYLTCVDAGTPAVYYESNGDGTFTERAAAAGIDVIGGWGAAWADYDRDGFMDLHVCVGPGTANKLFRTIPNGNKWLEVRLTGTATNRYALGTRVTVDAGGFRQIREVDGGHGTGCQNGPIVHFGLADYDGTVTVTIRWLNSGVQTITDVATNQILEVTEP